MEIKTLHHQKRMIPEAALTALLRRYWRPGMLLALALYILFNKDISIELGLSNGEYATLNADATSLLPEGMAVPAADAPTPKVKNTAPTTPVGNTMANLTPILSPDYAKRKGIAPEVAEAKIEICKNYVRRFAPLAIRQMQEHGIPASITLAQGLLESNAGESKLSMESNNHFGIKCRSKCRGCTCRNYADDDIFDMFRVFDSAWESYQEHANLLNGSRYAHLKKHGNDYRSWAHGLKKAGYATDPRYAEKLIQIISFLKLYRYDKEEV
jgi:flagellum-specific peptidoglycan hydrolase FlgJ